MMAEALGSLCDKVTIVKPKEWHSEKQPERMHSLATQEQQLRDEVQCIDEIDRQLRAAVEQLRSKVIKH
jgi:uncharacterized protein (DUF3084 family)